ncbi:MAG: hypothetical protein RLZZ465_6, partial [Bacteroidota bacterium]
RICSFFSLFNRWIALGGLAIYAIVLGETILTHKEEDKNCKTFGSKHGCLLVYPQLYA